MAVKKEKNGTDVSNESNWRFTEGEKQETSTPQDNTSTGYTDASLSENAVVWTAVEYQAHDKDTSWYIGLGAATFVVCTLIFLITNHDVVSTLAVLVISVAFGVFAAHKPQELEYTVDGGGIQIGPKQYTFDHFKSFAVMHAEGAEPFIMLLPLKRFLPSISVYYPLDQEDAITSVISNYLPMEQRSHDLTDKFMHKIRF